jgi:putative ABC transport system permease protein
LKLAVALRWMARESRGSAGRLLFTVACLAVGVAGVTAVSATVRAVEGGVRGQSRDLLAADLVVDSRRPLPPELDAALATKADVVRSDVRETATMVTADGSAESRLTELKSVAGGYPLYGDLVLDPPLPAGRTLEEFLGPDGAAVAPELMEGLGVGMGGTLRIGGTDFRVVAQVLREPDRVGFSMMLGPRVFLSAAGLERTAVAGAGSRVKYRAMVRVPGDPSARALRDWKDAIAAAVPGGEYLEIETHHDAQPALRRALERFERYLGLTALLALLLGGVGVARVVGAWMEARTVDTAVLRCLGARPREVVAIHLGHTMLLAVAGSALGAAAGLAAPFLLAALVPDLVPGAEWERFQPVAAVGGVLLGLATAAVFSLRPLLAAWRVPPARAFRAEAEPLPVPHLVSLVSLGALGGGVFLAALAQAGQFIPAALFTAGLGAVAALLAGGTRLTAAAVRRIPRTGLPAAVRHGLAAFARPGSGARAAVTALGLGVLTVVGTGLVRDGLLEGLGSTNPAEAPSLFLVDVQPDQWEEAERLLRDAGAPNTDSTPVVMARLAAVQGATVAQLLADTSAEGRGRRRWVLTREQRLTWRADLQRGNQIIEGGLWTDPARAEVSVEEGFAKDLGVRVGSTITLDVQGTSIELLVSSIRTVEWRTFSLNFFLVVEPGVLDDAPHFRVASAAVPEAEEIPVQRRLAERFPNITVLRVRSIVEQVARALDRVATAVRWIGAFVVAAGLAVLAGAVAAGAVERRAEVALLKTLGVTRGGVASLLGVEFALVGAVAGLLGGVGALALSQGFLRGMLEIEVAPAWWVPLAAAAGTAVLAAACGLAASVRALAVRPLEVLRG